jgi:hypothetical protein
MKTFQRASEIENRKFYPHTVNQNKKEWFANNGIFRYEIPIRDNDSSLMAIKHLLHELCETTKVPNIEFFLNKRDHPLMRADECEPYDCIFGPFTPLQSHLYNQYLPILSMCSKENFADIPIPNWDDWSRVCAKEGKYFPKCKTNSVPQFELNWNNKTPTAVFRGASTGFGVSFKTNMRLKIAQMSLERQTDPSDGQLLLDAGITSWNARPRIVDNEVHTLDEQVIKQIPLVSFMTMDEQSTFKYIVYIDGHVAAYRLSMLLGTGSVTLMVESPYVLWFSHLLVPYTHYVPIEDDLSNLYDQILWCKQHDKKCKQIAQNALQFYNKYLQKEGILAYLGNTLWNLKSKMGNYVYPTEYRPINIFRMRAVTKMSSFQYPKVDISKDTILQPLPTTIRSYDVLNGIQFYLYNSKFIFTEEPIHTVSPTSATSFDVYKISTYHVARKITTRVQEIPNETNIGLFCINPLLKQIPNFAFTYGHDEKNSYHEYMPQSITLSQYIKSEQFNINEFISILAQISFSIHMAQQSCLLMHCDLYPWNVLITFSSTPVYNSYLIDTDPLEYAIMKVRYIPVIIDYGKSRAVIDGEFYGENLDLAFSSIHDILTLLQASLLELLSRQLSREELNVVFQLASFFTNTGYTNYKTFTRVGELKQFLSSAKNYTTNLYSNKYELNSKTPLDFIQHLGVQFIRSPGLTTLPMRSMTGRFYLDCLLHGKEMALKTIVNGIANCTRNTSQGSFLIKHTCNRILSDINRLFSLNYSLYGIEPADLSFPEFTAELYNTLRISNFLTIFEDKTKYKTIYDQLSQNELLPEKVINTKESIVEYVTLNPPNAKYFTQMLKVENINYLLSIANRTTFLYLYNNLTHE